MKRYIDYTIEAEKRGLTGLVNFARENLSKLNPWERELYLACVPPEIEAMIQSSEEKQFKKEDMGVFSRSTDSFPVRITTHSRAGSTRPAVSGITWYLQQNAELQRAQEQLRNEREILEVLLQNSNEKLEKLANRIQAIENQKRMDISYALASVDVNIILNLLASKVTLNIEEVAKNITESEVINVVCDLCKARLANLKGKKLIITSLGLKVSKKLQMPND